MFAPAIELAEHGFPITEALAGALRAQPRRSSRRRRRRRRSGSTAIARSKWASASCRRISPRRCARLAANGSAAFYQGAIAQKIAAYMKSVGGLIDEKDLAAYKPFEDTPIHINYKGIDVYECPPNSQGHVMLQALNILEGMNVRYMRHNSAPYLHAVTEALKLSFADRNKWVGDPKFVPPIPMRELLSKEYAAAAARADQSRSRDRRRGAGRAIRASRRRASRSPGRDAAAGAGSSTAARLPTRTATPRISRSSTRIATWCRSRRRCSASSAAGTSSKAPASCSTIAWRTSASSRTT